jgi:hypothetical protein
MIDQCSQFPILFTVGLIYLPPTVFHKTNCLAPEIPVEVFS